MTSVPPSARMIPLVRPWTGEEEVEATRRVLATGMLVKGPENIAFERELAAKAGRAHAVTVNSGTSALYVALQALGVGPGARVVVPDLTFPATANAVLLCGATPVLCDVRPDTWNLDPAALAACIEGATAVMPVDQFGAPADWEEIEAIARRAGAVVLEDAACALGSERRGQKPGTRAAATVLSFHPRKPITTGEGGAVLTDDAAVAARCRTLRDHGIAGGRFVEPALNLRFPEMAAAMGRAQLGRLDEAVTRRRKWAALYRELLAGAPLGFQSSDDGVLHPYQTFAVELRYEPRPLPPRSGGVDLPFLGASGNDRDELVTRLAVAGVEASVASYALHRIDHLKTHPNGGGDERFPVASRLADRALALPLFPQMTEDDVRTVAAVLLESLRP